jgi:hypothetical protein
VSNSRVDGSAQCKSSHAYVTACCWASAQSQAQSLSSQIELGSAQASLDRQQDDDPIADRMPGMCSEEQQVFDLGLAQDFSALADHAICDIELRNLLYGD